MANLRRARLAALILLGASVLLLPGCFTILLWEDAPSLEAKEIAGAEVDAAHVLAVDFRFSNGDLERYHWFLSGTARNLTHVGRSDSPLPSVTRIVVPPSPLGVPGDRYVDGGEIELSKSMSDLRIRPLRPPGEIREVFIPDAGLDWRKSSNYGRVALTVPAVALDVVTSPFQLVLVCWILIAKPRS